MRRTLWGSSWRGKQMDAAAEPHRETEEEAESRGAAAVTQPRPRVLEAGCEP